MLRNKRKRVAALLAGCMVIGSSMSVYAGTASGYVGKQRTHLNVTAGMLMLPPAVTMQRLPLQQKDM